MIDQMQLDAEKYLNSLRSFLLRYSLTELFIPPVDHFAYKLRNTPDFETFLQKINDDTAELYCSTLNNRRIAVALLKQSINFYELGKTSVLEIIEPKPDKKVDNSIFEHIEIYHPQFDELEIELKAKNIVYELKENALHRAIILKINKAGQEIKYTNNNLINIIKEELTLHKSQKIK